MKIILLSILPMNESRSWSGINQNVMQQLSKDHVVESIYSPKAHKLQRRLARWSRLCYKIFGYRLNVYYHSKVAKRYAKDAQSFIDRSNADLILALGPATPLAFIRTDIKTFLLTDACFDLLQEGYDNYKYLRKNAIAWSRHIERKGLESADKILLTSSWAKEGLIKAYPNLDVALAHINFGSNIQDGPYIERQLPSDVSELRLLTFGHDPIRKGIDLARKLANELNCELEVIGADGWKDKNSSSNDFIKAYQNAHFLLLFSKADCTPVVVNEASAFGLPTLAFDVGGIKDVVKQGVNGYLVNNIVEAKDLIVDMENSHYTQIQRTSQDHYQSELSWQRFEERLLKEFED